VRRPWAAASLSSRCSLGPPLHPEMHAFDTFGHEPSLFFLALIGEKLSGRLAAMLSIRLPLHFSVVGLAFVTRLCVLSGPKILSLPGGPFLAS